MNGKPKYKELSASTQRLLLEKKEAFLKDLQAGWLSENTLASATFSQYLDLWLASVKRSRHLSTWQSYERCVRLHIKPTLGGYKMTDLRAIRFEAAFAERAANGCSVGNRKKIAEVIHAALEHAVRTDVLPRNPFALVKPTSTPAEIVPFAVDEIGRIQKAAVGNRLEALFQLAIGTGPRQGELLGLQWVDVDFAGGASGTP